MNETKGKKFYYIIEYVTLVNLFINAIFTVLTLYLLKKKKIENGYRSIVYSLTITQLLFELGCLIYYPLYYLNINNIILNSVIWNFIILSSGLLCSLYAFYLCNILCYVVITRKYLDIAFYNNTINFTFVSITYIMLVFNIIFFH